MKKTIVIILGTARSGSTLLSKTLGGHSNCFALGEINRFQEEINDKKTQCGCSLQLQKCSFWRGVLNDLLSENKMKFVNNKFDYDMGIFKQLTKHNKLRKLFFTILTKKKYNNNDVNKEIEKTLFLYEKIFKKTNSKVLIDSSKGLFRALVLASNSPNNIQFKFIHLIRDGRGILNSNLKSSYSITGNDGDEIFYKAKNDKVSSKIILNWLYINIRNILILYFLNNKKSTFIRYEDFTQNPTKILDKIFSNIGLKYESKVLELGGNENHILGGNSSRINAKVIKKQDDGWRKNLSKKHLKRFNLYGKWLNIILGYK